MIRSRRGLKTEWKKEKEWNGVKLERGEVNSLNWEKRLWNNLRRKKDKAKQAINI